MRAEREVGSRRPASGKFGTEPGWLGTAWLSAMLFLFGLWTLVVAQSLYSLLLANPNFLNVRLASNAQLLGLVVVFNLLPPLVLFLPWLVLHFCRPQGARIYLGLLAAVISLVFSWQIHNFYLGDRWQSLSNSYLFWLIPAGLLGIACSRSPEVVRSFGLLLCPFVFLLPAFFLGKSWSTHLEFMAAAQESLRQALAPAAPSERLPVFFIVFDELSLPVLLGKDGEIDAASYPHFREFARQATWFRQAAANGDYTNHSLPTLLAASFPRRGGLDSRTYPNNLFALLEPHYELFVYETWSQFCRPDRFHCLRDTDRLEASHASFLLDVAYLLAARVTPRGSSLHPPDVRKNWGFFHNPRVAVELAIWRFEKFLETVANLERPHGVFVFYHNSLPHSPYWVTSTGEIREGEPAAFDLAQRGDAAQVAAVLERYKAQVRYVDAQLGRLVELLKRRGLFDSSLLIVTSDHGVSYDLRAPGRDLLVSDGQAINAEPLLRVPLFIKLPGQQDALVSDREVQLMDIMPTVAELVDVEIPWAHSGRSMFAPAIQPRNRVAYDRQRRRHEFPGDPALGWKVLSTIAPPEKVVERPQ